jgi:hypothetical protein
MAVNLGKGGGGGGKVTSEIIGGEDSLRKLKAIRAAANQGAKALLERKRRSWVARAKELCPDDPRTNGMDLRTSIRAEVTSVRGGSTSVGVVAGGVPGVDYASIVHDDLTARHKVGGAKFIELAAREVGASVPGEMNDLIERAAR